jgi:hypothetical protein
MNDGRVSHNFFETRPPNAGLRSTHGLTVKQSQRKLSREAKNKKKQKQTEIDTAQLYFSIQD